jgi:hemoglobin
MTKQFLSALLLCVAALPLQAEEAVRPPPADDSVYQAFGQQAGIRALMEDFVSRLQADPRTAPFFEKTNRENLVAQLSDQLCQEGGGPCVYKGAPMRPVHEGMGIRKQDFNALVEVLQHAMDAKGIPFAAQNRMLARLAPMHREIIEVR